MMKRPGEPHRGERHTAERQTAPRDKTGLRVKLAAATCLVAAAALVPSMAFAQAGKPIFGVCRGLQLINVAFGGTLYQDLCADGATTVQHVHAEAYDAHGHALRMEPGNWFAQLHGNAAEGRVNSLHHQGIKTLGQGLEAQAWSDDGVIEAIRGTGESFIAGVQWHPEFHDGRDPALLPADPLMRAFLDAAATRRAKA